ncbi:hypothetical protein BT63DRAFT_122184 [Microthyrium microscopicum]|uniref:BTB domain-containing protein n=1 Tax=Microthyrium microscopicum TaxID=703497 RepID=A0A6A6TU44_9PEZI|nr:hypothetical protein BT63DRAFT_122184 [Microthyrium microscopicum]
MDSRDNDVGMLKSYLDTETFSDVVIECGERTWKAHRVVLCSASIWFRKALMGNFKEAGESKLVIRDEDPVILNEALLWIYGAKYETLSTQIVGLDQDNGLIVLLELYCLADFFVLPKMKACALEQFERLTENENYERMGLSDPSDEVPYAIPSIDKFIEATEYAINNIGDVDQILFDTLIKLSQRFLPVLMTRPAFNQLLMTPSTTNFAGKLFSNVWWKMDQQWFVNAQPKYCVECREDRTGESDRMRTLSRLFYCGGCNAEVKAHARPDLVPARNMRTGEE